MAPPPLRTLVISDLHLSAARSALREPAALTALLGAVARADGLLLLGDTLELRQRPVPAVLERALPALLAIGDALDAQAPITLVTGNHDHGLLSPWFARRDPSVPLGLATAVDPAPGDPLTAVVDALGAGRTAVAHPGVWLREDVWATHGHLADLHTTTPMLERLGAGLTARAAGLTRDPARPARVEDYEAALAPMYAWIDALAEHGSRWRSGGGASVRLWQELAPGPVGVARRVRRAAYAAAFRLLLEGLERGGLGPLSGDLSDAAIGRAPLRALGEVQSRLGVDARFIVCGHTHRAGPLPNDDPRGWRTPAGTALVNCGCWVREAVLAGRGHDPYRAGFAVWLDDAIGSPPELVNLLD